MSKTAKEIFDTRIEFKTLAEIEAHQFYGNAAFDNQAFQAIKRFSRDEKNTVKDQAEALRIRCDQGMGMGRMEEETDEEVLAASNAETS
jgi:hypothetical protein